MRQYRLFVLLCFSILSSGLFFPGLAKAVPPLSPTNVTASDGNQLKITVTWTAPTSGAAVETYKIYRSPVNSQLCPGNPIAEVDAPVTFFEDTSFPSTSVFYYSLRAANADGESACSNSDAGSAVQIPPPNPPVDVDASDNFLDRIDIEWTAPELSQPINNWQLFRTDDRGLQFCNGQLLTTLTAATLSYVDTSAAVGKVYYYALKSVGPTGISNCSPIPNEGRRLEPPPVFPPLQVQASDGTFEDKIKVTWIPPDTGGAVLSYILHRTTNPNAPGCGAPLVQNISAQVTELDDTNNVVPGVIYYYSMQSTGLAGVSQSCSNIDPGHARVSPADNLTATDGDFPDRVQVSWVPPAGDSITGFTLFRSEDPAVPCATGTSIAKLGAGTTVYIDRAVTPAVTYYYSLQTDSANGPSRCVQDPGFAITQCTDGIDNDGDGRVDYRADGTGDPGCLAPEDNDEKDPKLVCDNGLDDDGDGAIDYQVDGSGDPGCDSPQDPSEDDAEGPLKSPAFAKFNTFLGQWVFAELINQGTSDKQVDLTIFNLRGERMIERTVVVPAGQEVDVDINALVDYACDILNSGCDGFEDLSATRGAENGLGRPDGIVDTYGLVQFVFDDGDPRERLLGRMSFYRPNIDGSFSFAFAREFRNPSTGPTYATSNTYDPRGQGFLVPNWAEVIAFGKRGPNGEFAFENQTFTMNVYDQTGALRATKDFFLPGLGEFDIQAGHEFVSPEGIVQEGVYLVEVIPHDPEAEYFLTVSRYSSNAPPATDPADYNFAFGLEGRAGSTQPLYVPVSNRIDSIKGLATEPFVANWVEVACASDEPCAATAIFRSIDGVELGRQREILQPKSQFHFNASAVLPVNSSGSVEVVSEGAVVVQGMSYVHGLNNELQSGFASPGRNRGRAVQAGTINTFLGMQDVLTVFSTTTSAVEAAFEITSFRGGVFTGAFGLESGASSALAISNDETLNFPPDTFGALLLSTGDEGDALAEVRRIRVDDKGQVDFVMPTLVK
ncbi:MAG: hypothetical protein KDD69_14055 [Bdellovibrionales bacterium]|nr:hypothetical protein [Bdellovibrionales bacterium]